MVAFSCKQRGFCPSGRAHRPLCNSHMLFGEDHDIWGVNTEGSDAPGLIYIKYPDAPSLTRAQLHAIPHCSSEFIAFVEDHAFVEPEWVEGVLKGFETGADAVVYTYCDATPESVYSRAIALINYGKWMSEQFAGIHRDVPGGKPKISGPLILLGFRVVDSNLLHSSTAGISQDSYHPVNRVA
jgi:hypothetical protein